jgi:hypothetical protein
VAIEKLMPKWGDSNVGVITSLSGLTIVDVDGDENLARDLVKRIGDTPMVTRTPSGGCHLWYKSSGERNANLRSKGLPVDVKGLGAGVIVVPPSFRRSTGVPYEFERGSWDDLDRLPNADLKNLSIDGSRFESIQAAKGTRNDKLFRFALRETQRCDNELALRDALLTVNSQLDEPLSAAEVERIAYSAWGYQTRGENWVGSESRAVIPKSITTLLVTSGNGPDGLLLYTALQHAHGAGAVRHKEFAISAKAMSAARTLGSWSAARVRRARDTLLACSLIEQTHQGGRGAGDPDLFKLQMKGNDLFPNVTNTPSPR